MSLFFSGLETGLISIDQIALEQSARRNRSRASLLKFIRSRIVFGHHSDRQ
ncbi:MAG: DUF21 domain-containing protein [Candidatus Cloacimonetes bacterium]|nr:DUF21 domain-containing protein [Candidatus Cloacimonadota bacterium]